MSFTEVYFKTGTCLRVLTWLFHYFYSDDMRVKQVLFSPHSDYPVGIYSTYKRHAMQWASLQKGCILLFVLCLKQLDTCYCFSSSLWKKGTYRKIMWVLLYCTTKNEIWIKAHLPPPHIQNHFHLHCLTWEQLHIYTEKTKEYVLEIQREEWNRFNTFPTRLTSNKLKGKCNR